MADGSLIFDTRLDDKGLKSGLVKLGNIGAKAMGIIATTAGIATAAIGQMSISAYADYEQLVGGVDTLFKNSSEKVQGYADVAYKTAGLSANSYMETVTGFSASLLQSLQGDTEKAADYADMAIRDMSDNANKMGTNMGSIVDAYQGFAKQNYTMLDNLKLGYGGTKTEMERLLADAEKISGIKYDISSYADVVAAIHEIQKSLDITGTTALEAEQTITGSMASMKAATENLLAGLGNADADIGALTGNLLSSFSNVVNNLVPVIEQIAASFPEAIAGLGPGLGEIAAVLLNAIPQIFTQVLETLLSLIPELIPVGMNAVMTIANALIENIPKIVESATEIINSVINSLIENAPLLINGAVQMIVALANGLSENASSLIPQIIELINVISQAIITNLPILIQVAIAIVMALAQGLMDNLPLIIETAPRLINDFADAIFSQIPTLLMAGIQLILMIVQGLISAIPTLVANLPQIIMAIVNVFTLYNWWQLGQSLIVKLGEGLKSFGPNLIQGMKTIASDMITGIKNVIVGSYQQASFWSQGLGNIIKDTLINIFQHAVTWGKNMVINLGNGIFNASINAIGRARLLADDVIGVIKSGFTQAPKVAKDLIDGLIAGIVKNAGLIIDAVKQLASDILGAFKKKFNIKSPSRVMRDEVGKPIVQGIVVGIEKEQANLNKAIITMSEEMLTKAKEEAKDYKEVGTLYSQFMKEGIENSSEQSINAVTKLVNESIATLSAENDKASSEYSKAGKEVISAYTTAINDGVKEVQNEITKEVERITAEAQKQYDEIIKKKEDMASKLADFGELFVIDKETGKAVIQNINEQIDAIQRYDEVLSNLKSKGASDDFLNEVTKLGIDEATRFGEALLALTDTQFEQYQNKWNEKQKLARDVASKFYKDQLATLEADFVNKLDATLKSVPKIVENIGVNAIQGMIDGMDSRKDAAVGKAKEIADAIIAEMQRAMDIHSPSRVMRDLIGKNIVKGIEVGIDDEKRNLVNKMKNLVQMTKDDMSMKILGSSSKRSSGNPVITNNNDNGVVQEINIYQPVKSPVEMMREAKRIGKELAYG